MTSIFSSLARGRGTWDGELELGLETATETGHDFKASFDGCHLRHRPATDVHRHGVTVRARTRSARSDPDQRSLTPGLHSVTPDRALHLPKTYLTRQGALLLFTPSEVAADLTQKDRKCLQKMIVQQSREDCARGFGNLLRLAQSVLMYGGEGNENDEKNISDEDNKIYLKFLHSEDHTTLDAASQPGGDVSDYLQGLRSRASSAKLDYRRPSGCTADKRPSTGPGWGVGDGWFTPRPPTELLSADALNLTNHLVKPGGHDGSRPNRVKSCPSSRRHTRQTSAASLKDVDPQMLSSPSLWSPCSQQGSGVWPCPPTVTPVGSRPASALSSPNTDDECTCFCVDEVQMDLPESSPQEVQMDLPESPPQPTDLASDGLRNGEMRRQLSSRRFLKDILPEDAAVSVDDDIGRSGRGEGDGEDHEEVMISDVTCPLQPPYQAGFRQEDRALSVTGDNDISRRESDEVGNTADVRSDVRSDAISDVTSDVRDDVAPDVVREGSNDVIDDITDALDQAAGITDAGSLYTSQGTPQKDDDAPESDDGVSAHSGVTAVEVTSRHDSLPPSHSTVAADKTTEQSEPPAPPDVLMADTAVAEAGSLSSSQSQFTARLSSPGEVVDHDDLAAAPVSSPHGHRASSRRSSGSRSRCGSRASARTASSLERRDTQVEYETQVERVSQSSSADDVTVAGDGRTSPLSAAGRPEAVVTTPSPPQWTDEVTGGEKPPADVTVRSDDVIGSTKIKKKSVRIDVPPMAYVDSLSILSVKTRTERRGSPEVEPYPLIEVYDELIEPQPTKEETDVEKDDLLEKIEAALAACDDGLPTKSLSLKAERKDSVKTRPKTKKKEKVKRKDEARQKQQSAEKDAVREARRVERERRLKEAEILENKIKDKEIEAARLKEEAEQKRQEMRQQLSAATADAKEAQLMEEAAMAAAADVRSEAKAAREERRREDMVKKKAMAARRREEERRILDAARKMEKQMLERIGGGADEMLEREEEDEFRLQDAEMLAAETEEEEERLAKKAADEEEEKILRIEEEAEEMALARLVQTREQAEQAQWDLQREARRLEEEEQRVRDALLEEERILEAAMTKQREEEEEMERQETEKRLEREREQEAVCRRRQEEVDVYESGRLMRGRQNMEARSHLAGMQRTQGLTRPWVFSYYVQWPRDTYESLMGVSDDKRRRVGSKKKMVGKGKSKKR